MSTHIRALANTEKGGQNKDEVKWSDIYRKPNFASSQSASSLLIYKGILWDGAPVVPRSSFTVEV
ncbi:unnamed protein product [Protopolystoma xenopodis]|uniref:Uncharacterized protein n=1 Tax=Protopolystoma xenopodis TaxID=117903 RepID=A0A3S5APF7_9PLAT|nr:unnamed protein product [Protopolystoma xenopodis]